MSPKARFPQGGRAFFVRAARRWGALKGMWAWAEIAVSWMKSPFCVQIFGCRFMMHNKPRGRRVPDFPSPLVSAGKTAISSIVGRGCPSLDGGMDAGGGGWGGPACSFCAATLSSLRWCALADEWVRKEALRGTIQAWPSPPEPLRNRGRRGRRNVLSSPDAACPGTR